MDNSDSDQVPEQIRNRVQNDSHSFITRDEHLTEQYRYGGEISHEPVIGIQKEIDGMARLLCALLDGDEKYGCDEAIIDVYQEEVRKLRELEHKVISELPERKRDE